MTATRSSDEFASPADTAAWWDDVTFPSGDGQPGGDALLVIQLTVGPMPHDDVLRAIELLGSGVLATSATGATLRD